jgi:pullulanase
MPLQEPNHTAFIIFMKVSRVLPIHFAYNGYKQHQNGQKRGGHVFIHTERAILTLHYYRFDGFYDGWNAWIWPDGIEGAAFTLQASNSFGSTATIELHDMARSTKIGILLRRTVDGDDWGERETDDRFVEELRADGTTELWIIQGDPALYFDQALALRRKERRVIAAKFLSPEDIRVTVNVPPASVQSPRVELYGPTGAAVAIRSVTYESETRLRIEAETPLDITSSYRVRYADYEEAEVLLSGMFGHPEFERHYDYGGNDLGARCTSDATAFRLWAPTAAEACVVLYSKDDEPTCKEIPLLRTDQGTWLARLDGNLDGFFYTYKVKIQGEWREAVDPYAFSLSANGTKGAIVDLTRTDPEDWSHDARPPFDHPTDAVIYELHVRDATIHPDSGVTHPGTFLGLTEGGTHTSTGFPTGLDYIAGLHVTHVQLLPVNDFVSVDETHPKRLYNWGYDPAFYLAPEGSYASDPNAPHSRISDLKRLVQTFHKRGLRVVLDVVYNHLFSAARSSLERLVPDYYFRTDAQGRPANGTGVGNDTASERAMMRKLIVDSVTHWAREYHVDGFRFDLMGIHDIETMRAVRDSLDDIDPSILVYGEGWHLNTPLPEERKATLGNAHAMPRIGLFYDRFRDSLKGGTFDLRARGFANGAGSYAHDVWHGIVGGIDYGRSIVGFALEPEQTINYAEVHDNHTLWDRLQLSNPEDSADIRRRMQRLIASILLTSQGIPFLHAGQEWYRTKHGDHNSYRSPDVVNRLDWARAERYAGDIRYVSGLIAMRRAHQAFRLPTAASIRESVRILDTPQGVIAYSLQTSTDQTKAQKQTYVVVHNATRSPYRINLPELELAKEWLILCDGANAGPEPIAILHGHGLQGETSPLCTSVLLSQP